MISTDPFTSYDAGPYFCELTTGGNADASAAHVRARIAAIGLDTLRSRARMAEDDLVNLGITFTVYSEATAIDRILPFDCIPRIIGAQEWAMLEAGVTQRVQAINLFLEDIYNARRIVKDGIVPAKLIYQNSNYRPEMEGFPVRFGTYVHICGTDLVRDQQGVFRVLEDNARTPSGVSYVVRKPARDAADLSRPGREHEPSPGRRLRPPASPGDERHRTRGHRGPVGRAALAWDL